MDIIKKEKPIVHPMEEVLGIEEGTTVAEFEEIVPSIPIPAPEYDAKDEEIEGKLEEIYAFAMAKVGAVADQIDLVEGKYKARLGEVTATMLQVALGAVREKREHKKHKDTHSLHTVEATTPRKITQNNLVVSRNELLDMLRKKREG